ncbi:hypothetical protein [Dysgonomonas sp. 25]|uniref:hypothetical protein n=1 Tax=Dysgonomonas sp. 25 TaxID=2302933 RepID=UPI0013D0BA10|nr:hypothetical protein [Dysgonomonas sp. 25]NDV68038.1 hypothetical protein [Dysgonomonas sp. 25]
MKKCILIIPILLFLLSACNKSNGEHVATISNDTIVFEFEPNLLVKTEQYLKTDSLNPKIVKEAYYSDSLLLREIYCNNYMSSEYDGSTDAEYVYCYNKNKRLILKYCIESFLKGDTVRYQYQYFDENNNCEILIYDCRKRLKNDSISDRCMITEDDYTKDRIWQYKTKWIKKYDEQNRLIEHAKSITDSSRQCQNLYTYKYQGNKLVEKKSFLNNNIPYWTEVYEYNGDSIKMAHTNHDSFPIPFYTKITISDKKGNPIVSKKFDNNGGLMRVYRYSYDDNDRLKTMRCFNGENELKVTHSLVYSILE